MTLDTETDRALYVLATLADIFESDDGRSLAVPQHRRDPFRTLVATVISQRTRDQVTGRISRKVFELAPDAESLASLPDRELELVLKPAGFHRRKTARLKELAREIIGEYGGMVPRDRDALLRLPGVGRKTAALVLCVAFDEPAICVDTHVHRISNRLGLVRTSRPSQTEDALARLLPVEWWSRVNPLMIRFGQRTCRPVRPVCADCGFSDFCPGSARVRAGEAG